MSVGKNIKRLRTVMGLRTQKALVERLGVPPSQLSDWENDRIGADDPAGNVDVGLMATEKTP